jgi:hypothetical protein
MKKLLFATIVLLQFGFIAPTVNEKIIAFVDKNLGKKVGTGQCWDLASAALNSAGAKWTSPWGFGTKLNYSTEPVKPGDIIRFKNVKFKNGNFIGTYPEHTAIIYKVKKKGEWKIAEQNNNARLFVIISDFHLAWKTKGTIEIYRPK